jgi:hypothetical protein
MVGYMGKHEGTETRRVFGKVLGVFVSWWLDTWGNTKARRVFGEFLGVLVSWWLDTWGNTKARRHGEFLRKFLVSLCLGGQRQGET